MQKEQLVNAIADGMSQYELAEHFDCSRTSIRYWMTKYELTSPYARKAPSCGCGETDPTKFYAGKNSKCKVCTSYASAEKNRQTKNKLVEHYGGACKLCGFNAFNAALEFHHKDPATKDPNYLTIKNRKWERQLEELDKCILLCANCHRGVHAGHIQL